MSKQTPNDESVVRLGRVRFLAKLSHVREKVQQGYAMSDIYRQYRAALRISYSQFRRYVSQHVRPARSRLRGSRAASPTWSEDAAQGLNEQRLHFSAHRNPTTIEHPQTRRFVYDPTNLDEKLKDLI